MHADMSRFCEYIVTPRRERTALTATVTVVDRAGA